MARTRLVNRFWQTWAVSGLGTAGRAGIYDIQKKQEEEEMMSEHFAAEFAALPGVLERHRSRSSA